MSQQVSIDCPGKKVVLPVYLIKEIQELFPKYKNRIAFFGGHPVSITKASTYQIFNSITAQRESPYLVCEKTDGVRYLLLSALVRIEDLHIPSPKNTKKYALQHYLVSREGQKGLVAYAAAISLSSQLAPALSEREGKGLIVQILDGELIEDKNRNDRVLRYLVFDALVHLGRNIIAEPLRERLNWATRFLRCSEFLGSVVRPGIEVRIKDFFRLSCIKFNTVEFMIKKYVKCMPHENDGLIFNHEEKPYELGTSNPGYIKWKPAHLNTVDFMIVPNNNLEDRFGRRILDLYLAVHDNELERYSRTFYSFAIINQSQFVKIQERYEERQREQYLKNEGATQFMQVNEFMGAMIAECRYEPTNAQQRKLLIQLYKNSAKQLLQQLMKQKEEQDRQLKAIENLKSKIHDKCWKIYKIRNDKSLPNNIDVVRRIQESIRDGINQQELIKKNYQLLKNLNRNSS